MQSYSTSRDLGGSYVSEIWPWWTGPYNWPHYSDDFTVTGFGPNPGKRYVDPVPGEYTVEKRWRPKGTHKILAPTWGGGYIIAESWDGPVQNAGSLPSHDVLQYTDLSYDGNVYNEALSDFYENLRDSESNLALTLGEARESARMLQVGKSIYEVILMARKAKRQALLNPSKTLSEIWLSYKYGWQPFLSDIYSYTKWYYDLLEEGFPIRGRARRKEELNKSIYDYGDPVSHATLRGKQVWKAEVKCFASVSDGELYNLSRVTSLNPLSIAWELVPLSFVVDWFYDIGGYLQNMEAAFGAGLTFKRGYVSEVVHINASIRYKRDYVQYGSNYRYISDYESKGIRAKKRRTKLSSFPFPRAPAFRARLGWQRILSAAALIRVILLGKVK